MEFFSDSTGEAWEKICLALIGSGEESIVTRESVIEVRWLSIHLSNPEQEPRISDKFNQFAEMINLQDEWKPDAYLQQVTKKKTQGY